MIARLITVLNVLARRLSVRTKILKRLFQILTDYAWITVYYFWEFDLKQTGRPWRNVDFELIRWSFATAEDCRAWSRSEADGFSADDCELFLDLIEKGDRVLVGFLPEMERKDLYEKQPSVDLPDCYAVCATKTKPITSSCIFQMKDGEGTIRTVYTRQATRGRGLAGALYAKWAALAEEEGFQRLFIDIESSNIPSFRAAEKSGAVRFDSFAFFQIRFFKRSFIFPNASLKNRLFYQKG